jgi:hypothetical protein
MCLASFCLTSTSRPLWLRCVLLVGTRREGAGESVGQFVSDATFCALVVVAKLLFPSTDVGVLCCPILLWSALVMLLGGFVPSSVVTLTSSVPRRRTATSPSRWLCSSPRMCGVWGLQVCLARCAVPRVPPLLSCELPLYVSATLPFSVTTPTPALYAEDKLSCLDKFRQLITHIGNTLGYVRMVRSAGMHHAAEAIQVRMEGGWGVVCTSASPHPHPLSPTFLRVH